MSTLNTALIADDHPLVQQYLVQLLRQLNPACEILVTNLVHKTFELVKSKQIDLLLLDLMLDDGISIGNIAMFKQLQPGIKILVLSTYSAEAYGSRAISLGADGFLNKKASLHELIDAIKIVASGKKYLSQDIMYNLAFLSKSDYENPFESLTDREFEITVLMLQGKSVTKIANEINLQRSTVSTHKMKILEKLNVSNIIELQAAANKYNISHSM